MSLWRGNISRTQKKKQWFVLTSTFQLWHQNHTIFEKQITPYTKICEDVAKGVAEMSDWVMASWFHTIHLLSTLASWISRISCWKIGFHWRKWYHMLSKSIMCICHTHIIYEWHCCQHIGLFQEPRETCELMKVYSDWIWMNVYKQATRAELSAARRKNILPTKIHTFHFHSQVHTRDDLDIRYG